MTTMFTLWKIAGIEWKLQLRSTVFWVGLVTLLLYNVSRTIGAPGETAFLPVYWISSREDLLTWSSLVLIFLIPLSLARDKRTTAFLFSTPVSGHTYAAGKLIGLWFVAFTLAGIELVIQWMVRLPALGFLTAEAMAMIVASTSFWVVGLFFVTSVYFLVTVLAQGKIVISYILSALYFFLVFSNRDVLNPLSYIPAGFVSDLIYFGPETGLRMAHTALYASLILPFAVLAVFMYPVRQPGINQRMADALALLLLFSAGLPLTFMAITQYQQVLSEIAPENSSYAQSSHLVTDLHAVEVKAIIDTEAGFVDGSVSFNLKAGLQEVLLDIPKGLRITSVTSCDGQPLSSLPISVTHWRVTYSPDICVTFEGNWQPHLSSYQTRTGTTAFNVGQYAPVYLGQHYLYILPGAHWFPTLSIADSAKPTYTYTIALPAELPALNIPEAQITNQDNWNVYEWHEPDVSAYMGLTAGDFHQLDAGQNRLIWVAREHLVAAEKTGAFIDQFLQPIYRQLAITPDMQRLVETPLLRWPIVTPEFVLVPERLFEERLVDIETNYESIVRFNGEQEAYYRMLYEWTRGVMHGHLLFADARIVSRFSSGTIEEDIVHVSGDRSLGYVPLEESLIYYIVLQMTDARFATELLDEAIDIRLQYADRYLNDPTVRLNYSGAVLPDLPPIQNPPYERHWAFNQIFAALGQLERQIGREQVNLTIQTLFARYVGRQVTLNDWIALIGEMHGEEVSRDFEKMSEP